MSGNDSFTVNAYNLDSSSSYTIRVTTNRDDIGLNNDCSTRRQTASVPQGTSHNASFTLYGCDAPGGTVTATLLLGSTVVDTATQSVSVSLGETVTITGLGGNLNVGASDPFTVTASNLDTSTSYVLRVTTDGGGGIAFDSGCTDHEEQATVTAGSASYSITAANLSLYGCGTAGGTVTATLLSGNTTIAETSRAVNVQSAGSPTISINDLLPALNESASDAFTVSVGNLDSTKSYTIEVTADDSDIGFNSDCTDQDAISPAITGKTSDTASFTLYGCDSAGGTVTAELKSGGSTVVSDTQRVTVNEPTITIKGLALSLNEAASHAFTVGIDNLDSSSSYTIRLTTDDDDLGFNNDCSTRQHDVAMPASITSHTTGSITLYGCDEPGGTVTAVLLRGTTEVARDSQDVTVNEPTIQIVGLADDVNQGASRSFVVSVGNLAASSSHTIRVSTSNGNIGFNTGCTLQQSDQSVPSSQTSHTATFTLYGCAGATETVTAKLLRAGAEVKTATQEVTVNASTIALEDLDAPLYEDASVKFTVRVEHLGSSQPYTIRITTNNTNIGFSSDCSDQQEDVTVQNSVSHTSSLTLHGCSTDGGTLTAKLLLGNTEIDTDTHDVTVLPNPTIEITGLVESIDEGENDPFTVALEHLDSSASYTIRLTTDNINIGFNSDCTERQKDVSVSSGGTSHTTGDVTLYGCAATGGTVTANLLLDGNSIANDTQDVTVIPSPVISISDLATSIDVGASDEFTVSAQHLVSSETYSIRVTTDSGRGIGFNSDCTDTEEPVSVDANSQTFTSTAGALVLYGCGTAGGTVTAKLLSGNTEVDTAIQAVTVQLAGSSTIAIDGLVSELKKDATDAFTVSVSNLDSSTSYTIEVTTDNADIGFNSDCTDREESVDVPANSLSHTTASITLTGCDAEGGKVTATLKSGGNSLVSAEQTVTVLPDPTISISDLSSPINVGQSDEFTVAASNLVSTETYTIKVTTNNGGGIGFNSDCTDHEEPVTVPASSEDYATTAGSLVLYGCGTAGGTVTAKLLSGITEVDTATQAVTVQLAGSSTIAIDGLVSELKKDATDAFTVSVGNLDSSISYTIELTTDNADIGFTSDCTDREESVDVPANSLSHTTGSITLYGCDAEGGKVTATLKSGGNSLVSAEQTVTVLPDPTISISDLSSPINVGQSDEFTVAASNLVSTETYTIKVTTDNGGGIGFNSDCTDHEEQVTVPASSEDYATTTGSLVLYGCGTAGGTVTAKLLRGSTEVDTATQAVTVQLAGSSTIAIENLVPELKKDATDAFTVSVGNLDSSISYTIELTTDNADIGFTSDCTDREESVDVPANSLSHTTGSITLTGCDAEGGEVTATLKSGGNSLVSAEQTVTVLPDPTISISDLSSPINVGQSDEFTVAASNLDSTETYTIKVTTNNGGGIGFNSDCTDHEEQVTVPASSEDYATTAGSLVLYGCGTAGGTVTAKLLRGSTEVDTATQAVTVQLAGSSTIAIEGLVSELKKDATDAFTVSVGNLDSSTSYTIELTTDNADIGFNSDCTDREESVDVPANSLSHTTASITLTGCDAEGGKVTATLKSGGNSLVSAEKTVTVLPDPSVQISGLLGTVYYGENDAFTVSASNLDSSTSYTIRVTTNNANIGFDNNCSDQQEDETVPASNTSHSASLTLYACNTTGGTVTATLLAGGNTIDTATQSVTVSIRPSIAFSGLANTVNVGFNDEFRLIASDLDSSTTYTIRVTTDSSNIGFNDDCTDQQEDPTVPASITSHTTGDIMLYGCATDGGTVTATLSSGGNTIATATQEVGVEPASSQEIGFAGFMGPFRVGWGHSQSKVMVRQLDSTKSYKVQMTLDDDEDGDRIGLSFDSGCSEQEKEVTVPAGSTSHDIWFDIEPCDRTSGTLTVKTLLADDNSVVATETHRLQVFEGAEIDLLGLDRSTQRINVGASEDFGIRIIGLDSTNTFTVHIKTDETGARLDSDCTLSEKVFVLTGKTSYSTSAGDFTVSGTTYDTLYGCEVKRGTLWVRLYRGTYNSSNLPVNAHRWDFHTINVRNP